MLASVTATVIAVMIGNTVCLTAAQLNPTPLNLFNSEKYMKNLIIVRCQPFGASKGTPEMRHKRVMRSPV
jgi:hypothetical protein